MSNPVIQCEQVSKSYHDGQTSVDVLRGIDLTIQQGERIAIVGPSGSGKSTLLHLLGGLDWPTTGKVSAGNVSWQALSEKQRCRLRNTQFGFIYQFHHLLPEFTALENVALPLLLAGLSVGDAKERAHAILGDVGLAARVSHKPSQLSGGERQRVAITRALVHQPQCVFADEPTGNLDQTTAHHVFELMIQLNRQANTALVIVTHDLSLAGKLDRVLSLQDGQLSPYVVP